MPHKKKEDANAYMRNYRKTHPEIMRGIDKRHASRVKKNRDEKREKIVVLMGGKCKNCGYDKCKSALEMHHRNPKEKEKEWRRNVSFDKMIIESKKCDMLCANCHREEHERIKNMVRVHAEQ